MNFARFIELVKSMFESVKNVAYRFEHDEKLLSKDRKNSGFTSACMHCLQQVWVKSLGLASFTGSHIYLQSSEPMC